MEKIKTFLKKYWIGLVIIASSILFDQVTKIIVTNVLEYEVNNGVLVNVRSTEVIKGFFSLTYARNTGAGWSMLSDKTWLLIVITVLAFGVFIYLMKDFDIKKHRFFSIGISLMLGGTIGNFIERVFKGYVTDFLDFIIFGYDYPIFNVADICLVVGTISLLVSLLLTKEAVFDSKKDRVESNESNDTNASIDANYSNDTNESNESNDSNNSNESNASVDAMKSTQEKDNNEAN